MSIDKRQLSNLKQYPRNRRNKQKYILFITLLFTLTLFYLSTFTTTTTNIFKDTFQYNDSSQLTDYHHIRNLINKNSRINKDDKQVFLKQLLKGSGHTFDELRRLTNSIPIPILSTTTQNKLVPVTAIIHTNMITQLYRQLQAVLTQSVVPEHIWIICNVDMQAEVEARIMTLDRRRVRVIAMDEEWLRAMAYVASDYVWLIDQNIAPGKRYLENLLKLSSTMQYRSALLGTEAASLDLNSKEMIECIPDTMHSSSFQKKSQFVDMINDSWLLYRAWVPYLLEALDKRNGADPLNTYTGLFISRTLYMTIGVPSIAIPTDPIERAYWGDVRLQKTQKSETCKSLSEMTQQLHAKDQLMSQDIMYRGRAEERSVPMMFYVDSLEELEGLVPLMCRFEKKKDVAMHVVTSGFTRGVSDHEIKVLLATQCHLTDTLAMNLVIHDIGVLHESVHFVNDVFHRFTRILAVVQPRIVIHSHNSIKPALETVPDIYLPMEEIPHALWIANLPANTLAKWDSFSIRLMITTEKKPHALTRVLTSASSAYYFGDRVDLTLFMDQTSDSVTKALANNYHWKRGRKYVRHRIASVPQMSVFVESWYPTSNDEYAIIISDQVELSPLFYMWAKYAILQYRYSDTREDRVFGVSLYAPRVVETNASGRVLFEAPSDTYLMQWPSYAGAVYFPEQWREFHDYMTARVADESGFDMQQVSVPNLRSSDWTFSWRRYFEELAYLRSYVMVFPSTSFSTLHVELKKKKLREQYDQVMALYRVPLAQRVDMVLPTLDRLPVLDIWGKESSLEELQRRGSALHEDISACPVIDNTQYDPSDLLCPFARIVTVTLKNENDSIPELPLKDVYVYSV